MEQLKLHPEQRKELGEKGKVYVTENFDADIISQNGINFINLCWHK